MSLRENNMPRPDPLWVKLLPAKIRVRMEGRHNLFAVLHNSGWLVADKVFRALAAIVVSAWVARYLGPEEYGKLAYILAIVAVFQIACALGLDGIVVRDIAKNKEEASLLLGTTFMMRLVAGLVCWTGLVFSMAIVFGWGNENMWLSLFIGGSLIFQAGDTIDLWFQSQVQSRRTVLAKFIAVLISSSLRVLFIVFKAPLLYFAVAFFAETAIVAVALAISYQLFKCGQKWQFRLKERGKILLKESWPFIVSGLSVYIYMRVDQVMIRNILGEKELGIFSAVIALSTGWYFLPVTLCSSLLPSLSKLRTDNKELYLKRTAKIFRLLLLLSIGISLFIYWQGENLIALIFGEKYIAGHVALGIHVFTNISVFLGVGQSAWILNEKKQKLFLLQTLAGGATSVLLNLMLIPKYGIAGASISAAVSMFISAVLINFIFAKKLFYLQLGIYKKNTV